MSLKDEIEKLVKEYSNQLAIEAASEEELYNQALSRIKEIQPLLDEIKSSVEDDLIKIDIRERWESYTVAAFVRVGDVKFCGEWSYSEDMIPVGEGCYWYFFPCYSDEYGESWSFNDWLHGHRWFDSLEEMMNHLVPRVAKEIARYKHNGI
ncbi:hypothetical protein ACGRSR_05110 [Vibrio owensii]|uniref:hypothetical protein n=1 Tax=Vibrio owensii TaxID=696485 RepID=UPI00374A71AD